MTSPSLAHPDEQLCSDLTPSQSRPCCLSEAADCHLSHSRMQGLPGYIDFLCVMHVVYPPHPIIPASSLEVRVDANQGSRLEDGRKRLADCLAVRVTFLGGLWAQRRVSAKTPSGLAAFDVQRRGRCSGGVVRVSPGLKALTCSAKSGQSLHWQSRVDANQGSRFDPRMA